jgi:hypothetical protein
MGLSTIAAGKEVLRLTKEHVERRESFAVETTLSGKNYLQMMQHARGIDRGSCRCFSDQGRRCGQERVCYETRFTVLKARVTDEKADLSVLMPLGINGVEAAGGISSSQ